MDLIPMTWIAIQETLLMAAVGFGGIIIVGAMVSLLFGRSGYRKPEWQARKKRRVL